MIILGIDPGIARVGWGVINKTHLSTQAVEYGCITTSKERTDEERLKTIYEDITSIIAKHKPEKVAVEKLFFAANAKTAFIVGQARGVILLAAAQHSPFITSYTPLEVKMALTGYGRADKGQMQRMVQSILRLSQIPQPDDTADALAIAITASVMKKFT